MKQNRTDQNCQRNGEHDAEASGKALHDRDTNVIGIDDLLIGKVVGVIQKKCADTASGECEDQGVAVCSHHVPSDTHACFEQFLSSQGSILLVNLINGTADRHGDIHNCSETRDQEPGEKKSAYLDAVGIPESHKCLDIRYIVTGNPGCFAEAPGGKTGQNNACQCAKCRCAGLFCRTADEVHSDQCGEKTDKNSGPERRKT